MKDNQITFTYVIDVKSYLAFFCSTFRKIRFRCLVPGPWLPTEPRSVKQDDFSVITEARLIGSDFCRVGAKPRLESRIAYFIVDYSDQID